MINGVEPEVRSQLVASAAQMAEAIAQGLGVPPLKEMADIFMDRSVGDDSEEELTPEMHVEALSEMFMAALIMLAERQAEAASGQRMEIFMQLNLPDGESDEVRIVMSGYRDPRAVVAALSKLDSEGYLDQLWNAAVGGEVDPDGPKVYFRQHKIAEKGEQ